MTDSQSAPSTALFALARPLGRQFWRAFDLPGFVDLERQFERHRPVATRLADQRAGGSIAWAMGEIPILLALVATFIQWMREDKRETKRIDRNEARLAAMGEPDELAQYNAYLTSLAAKDTERNK